MRYHRVPTERDNRVSTCCLTGRFKTLNSTSSGTQSRWLTAGSSTMSLKSSLLNMGIPIQHLVLSIRFLMIQSIPRSPKIPPGRLPASMNLSTHLRIATSIRQVNGILDVSSLTAIVGSTGSTAKNVLSYDLGSAEMKTALQESKWSHIDEFGKRHRESWITIQDHGDRVQFRNIKLRELPETSAAASPEGEFVRIFNGRDLTGWAGDGRF